MKRAVDGRRRVGRDLPAAKSSRELFSAPLKGRVLVVDDAAPMCEILSLFLTYKGLEVKTANSPAEALSHASQTQFDLIILDWDLAGIEALDLLNFFKGIWPATSVIVFTEQEVEEAFLKKALAGRADAIRHKLGSLDSLWKEVVLQLRKKANPKDDASGVREV